MRWEVAVVRALLTAAALVLSACANSKVLKYKPASTAPLRVALSDNVQVVDTVIISGVTETWGAVGRYQAGLPFNSGPKPQRRTKSGMQETDAPKPELARVVVETIDRGLRQGRRFQVVGGQAPEARFQFAVTSLMFVAGGFSRDVFPMVGIEGKLVSNNGTVLWKYLTTIHQLMRRERVDVDAMRNDSVARNLALQSSLRESCAEALADLER